MTGSRSTICAVSRRRIFARIAIAAALAGAVRAAAQHRDLRSKTHSGYLGFDRNDYPGDAALPALRKSFRYTSYWLNNPPNETRNSWAGKRALLRQQGFGFLVLFNGRVDAQLRGGNAAALGKTDGQAAVAAARREGFAPGLRIFLDQEEGGRLLPEQAAYLLAWIDAVEAAGARAGIYCSGIPVREDHGTISTAEDIVQRLAAKHARARHRVALWVANDACPPSPGCTFNTPSLASLNLSLKPALVSVWQYAQSPRRKLFSDQCPRNTAADGNCYAPGLPPGSNSFVDLNVAQSPDPSQTR